MEQRASDSLAGTVTNVTPDELRFMAKSMPPDWAARTRVVADRMERLEAVLTGIVDHWWEFGDMIVFNNVENKDDYGFSERIDLAAKLVKPT